MAVNQIPKKRGGVEETIHIGIHEDGNCRNKVESVNPQPNGLRYKKRPKKVTLNFGEDGELLSVFNEWLIRELTPTGELIEGQIPKPFDFESSEEAKSIFVQRFVAILYSMQNGLNSAEGFHEMEVFNSTTGAVMQYTEEQMNQPPVTDRNDPRHYLYIAPEDAGTPNP